MTDESQAYLPTEIGSCGELDWIELNLLPVLNHKSFRV